MKYAWVQEHRDSFPVAAMCRVLRVSPSGYYDSLDREPSKQTQRHERIKQAVQQVHTESYGIYGSVKITDQLQGRDDLESACRNTVAKAMKRLGLRSKVKKAFEPTTTKSDPSKRPAPNTLDRCFAADGPNRKWVTDITYLKTAAGWIYLAVVLDLFSRKVVGWSLSDSLETTLVSDALRDAIEKRRPERGKLLHHSDRGCQYTSEAYQKTLRTLEVEVSMSRTGIVAAEVYHGDQSDTHSLADTAMAARTNVSEAGREEVFREVVADKGYHAAQQLELVQGLDVRAYVPEPERRGKSRLGEKPLEVQRAVKGNRRRTKTEKNGRLQKLRSKRIERSFAHVGDTGGARRTRLRGIEKVRKRLLITTAAHNLGLLMRKLFGIGKPRALQGLLRHQLAAALQTLLILIRPPASPKSTGC